jgi:hypothetical protein
MKDLQDVLRHKEEELQQLEKEIGILRAAQMILARDPAQHGNADRDLGVAGSTDVQMRAEEVPVSRPKRAFP